MRENPLQYRAPGTSTESKFEMLHAVIFENPFDGSVAIAQEIADLISSKAKKREKCVLGLATGSSPKTVYKELIRLHREEALSFRNVITFNLDEYYPIDPSSAQSYVRFMREQLFDHIDIPESQVHIPDGKAAREEVDQHCQSYEQMIEDAGGLDLQILGIGRTGHIGFNEPGSHINSLTRIITLDPITKMDAARDFSGEQNVPKTAITMGIGTILKAKRIILMAWGDGKSEIVQRTLETEMTTQVPATYLQTHKNTSVVLDTPAAQHLIRKQSPWLTGSCVWDNQLTKRAVIWLSLRVGKPILKLTERDYNDNSLSDLMSEKGSAYRINIELFNTIQHTITGWPGGKPGVDDSNRPERASPAKKRVLIFSPHPDDDMISMGGTLIRLKQQGHDVHVAYQTSGSLAVFDDEVRRHAMFFDDLIEELNERSPQIKERANQLLTRGSFNDPLLVNIRKLIRKSEALSALYYVGIGEQNAHFLNMPFYETGSSSKLPLSAQDIEIVQEQIQMLKPHQIYVAADLSDPHGTHRSCFDAVMQAFENIKHESWVSDCYVWLYKGAWQEWDLTDIDMAVPLSPEELSKKRQAIFKHQSQKDSAPYPGNDSREFWERAEDRNRNTAVLYDQLGMAEYEAIEAFKRYYPI